MCVYVGVVNFNIDVFSQKLRKVAMQIFTYPYSMRIAIYLNRFKPWGKFKGFRMHVLNFAMLASVIKNRDSVCKGRNDVTVAEIVVIVAVSMKQIVENSSSPCSRDFSGSVYACERRKDANAVLFRLRMKRDRQK